MASSARREHRELTLEPEDAGVDDRDVGGDGRVVEDFKLTSGTFVLVGTLRTTAMAAATPVLQDAVVCGQDREYVGLLGFPNVAACRQLAGDAEAGGGIFNLLTAGA